LQAKPAKILPLESLRGLAAFAVALFHFKTNSFLTDNPFIRHSYVMVDLFFVLSGFVIALNYWDHLHNFKNVLHFQTKRFWRLYPLHLVTLLIFLLIECAKYIFSGHYGVNYSAFTLNDGFAFVNNLFLTQGFLHEPTFNYPSWSISTEFYAYLVFALLSFIPKLRPVLSGLIVVGSGYYLYLQGGSLSYSLTTPFVRCLYCFFLGVISYQIRNIVPTLNTLIPTFFLAVSILAVCLTEKTSMQLYIPVIFSLLVLALAKLQTNTHLHKIISHSWLLFLGTISYSIYMIHALVWWIVNRTAEIGFHRHLLMDDHSDVSNGIATAITLLGLTVILSVSRWTYIHVESRFRYGVSHAPIPTADQTRPAL